MNVEQLMSRPVATCSPNDTLAIAAQKMWDRELGAVVVVEEGVIVGMITDRDVAMGAYTSGQALWEVPVRRSMTPAPTTILQNATVAAAEKLMREHRVRRLPVIDRTRALVGLISLDDIAREARDQYGRRDAELSPEGVTATLGAVTEPRKSQALAVDRPKR